MRSTQTIVRLVITTSFFALSTGCTNKPGTLKLTLESDEPVVTANQPIRIRAVLTSEKETSCVPKWIGNSQMQVCMFDSAGRRIVEPEPEYLCGTSLIPMLPVVVIAYPFALIGGIIDMADIGGRFDIVEPGKPVIIEFSIALVHCPPESMCISIVRPNAPTEVRKIRPASWIPDEYRIVVTMPNEYESSIPPPLFWQPYSHPLTTEITVRVSPNPE